ncbi:MAG: CDP-diacylglycerol--glycerol-3-phosphate 3-phosphatidyltransferase [Acidobacteriota bacterium]
MNLPNFLTFIRIFLVPFLVVVLLTKFEGKELWGFGIFIAAAFTDWFDGYIARKKKLITKLGKFLDPVADKLLTSSAFISLVEMNLAPAWMVVIIIGREIAVTGLRAIAASQGVTISASILGKFKMEIEVICISLLILGKKYLGDFIFLGKIFLWVAMIMALISAAEYLIKFWKIFSDKTLRELI